MFSDKRSICSWCSLLYKPTGYISVWIMYASDIYPANHQDNMPVDTYSLSSDWNIYHCYVLNRTWIDHWGYINPLQHYSWLCVNASQTEDSILLSTKLTLLYTGSIKGRNNLLRPYTGQPHSKGPVNYHSTLLSAMLDKRLITWNVFHG